MEPREMSARFFSESESDPFHFTTPHTDANSIQKDNHQLISKRQKGAPLSAPNSAYTKVDTFLLHKLVQRITPAHSCTHDTRIPAALIAAVG